MSFSLTTGDWFLRLYHYQRVFSISTRCCNMHNAVWENYHRSWFQMYPSTCGWSSHYGGWNFNRLTNRKLNKITSKHYVRGNLLNNLLQEAWFRTTPITECHTFPHMVERRRPQTESHSNTNIMTKFLYSNVTTVTNHLEIRMLRKTIGQQTPSSVSTRWKCWRFQHIHVMQQQTAKPLQALL